MLPLRHLGPCLAASMIAGVSSAQFIYTVQTIPPAFTDISATGTPLGLAGLSGGGVLAPIGFEFTFGAATVSAINVSTEGYLTTGSDLTDFTPDCPAPSNVDPNAVIAPFWDDLDLTNNGEVFIEVLGPADNREWVVQWNDVGSFGNTAASFTFQAKLYDTTDTIEFHYDTLVNPGVGVEPTGGSAFVGLESANGGEAISVGCLTPGVIGPTQAYRFERDLPRLEAPDLVVSGATFSVPGVVRPGSFYAYGWSPGSGPIGPLPGLGGITLDLGPIVRTAGIGIAPANGLTQSEVIVVPPGLDLVGVNWQLVTADVNTGPFPTLSGFQASSPQVITVRTEHLQVGAVTGSGLGDVFRLPLAALDSITIELCRTGQHRYGPGHARPAPVPARTDRSPRGLRRLERRPVLGAGSRTRRADRQLRGLRAGRLRDPLHGGNGLGRAGGELPTAGARSHGRPADADRERCGGDLPLR